MIVIIRERERSRPRRSSLSERAPPTGYEDPFRPVRLALRPETLSRTAPSEESRGTRGGLS